MCRILCLSIVFILHSFTTLANDSLPTPRPFTVNRMMSPVELDGNPSEKSWQAAPSLSFHVLEPVWGTPVAEKTDMRLLYDDNYLYVGGKCYYRDPSKIVARNFIKDGWRGDDWVAVHIDSRFDHRTAINFAIYPTGSRFDMSIANDAVDLGSSPFNSSFNAIWDARSQINAEGWFFEMKIPLYNLRYRPAPDGTVQMAISITRWSSYNNELQHSVQIPQGIAAGFLRPSLKQEIRFGELKRHKLLLLTPYVAASRMADNRMDKNADKFRTFHSHKLTGGLDAKVGISGYLTMDATINPDFGQAEADLQQLNLSRFSLYLPERRPFFQEQSGLFDFSLGNNAQLFYSRRIGLSDEAVIPLYGGLRLTGQLNSNTDIGLLNMQSRRTHLNDSTTALSENYGALRIRRKVMNDKSFVGLLLTNRNSRRSSNYVIGSDAVLNLAKNHYLKIGMAASHSRDSLTQKFNLASSRISLLWENLDQKGWVGKGGYTYAGKDFDPQLGFLDRQNFHHVFGELAYGSFAKNDKSRFTYQKFSLLKLNLYKNAETGKTESINSGLEWRSFTVKATGFTLGMNYQYESLADSLDFGNDIVVRPGVYHFPAFSFLMIPSNSKKISFPVGFGAGGFFGGHKYFFSFSPDLNGSRTLHIQPGYDYTYLHFPHGHYNRSTHIHIARLRVTYAPDLHLSAAVNFQFNSAERKIFTNARVRYNFSDGHDLYLVLNNDSRTQRLIDGIKAPIREQQQWLVKYYYTLRLNKRGSR